MLWLKGGFKSKWEPTFAALLVIYGTEIPKEFSVILLGIKLDEDGKLKVSQKQVKRVIKEMRSALCFWKFKLLGKI